MIVRFRNYPRFGGAQERKDPVPQIGRFPPFGKRFFKRARKILGSCQFQYLWRVVIVLASMEGRKSLERITNLCKRRRTRQALSLFLALAETAMVGIVRETLRRAGDGRSLIQRVQSP